MIKVKKQPGRLLGMYQSQHEDSDWALALACGFKKCIRIMAHCLSEVIGRVGNKRRNTASDPGELRIGYFML